MNKKGFTLIEMLAVIAILGILMIIVIPSVSKYIYKSDRAVYASNILAYTETIQGKYEMKDYGAFLRDDEIMLVPIRHIILEKGDNTSSPYGEYDFDRSYVLITPERNGYSYYVTVIDSSGAGVVNAKSTEMDEAVVQEEIEEDIPLLEIYEVPGATYTFNEHTYRRSDVREIVGEDVNLGNYVYVFKKIA